MGPELSWWLLFAFILGVTRSILLLFAVAFETRAVFVLHRVPLILVASLVVLLLRPISAVDLHRVRCPHWSCCYGIPLFRCDYECLSYLGMYIWTYGVRTMVHGLPIAEVEIRA